MTHAVPSAEAQVEFLHRIQRILSEGSFSASYKYALLHALADLSVAHATDPDPAGPLTLSTREIALAFVDLYWRQAQPFHRRADASDELSRVLRQNTDRQALIVRLVGDLRDLGAGSLVEARRRRRDWERLVAKVDANVRLQPLWKLQVVGRAAEPLLYDNVGSGTSITLYAGVAFCFRTFRPMIIDLVRGAWVRYVRRTNADVFQDLEELHEFLFGREREDLSEVRPLLQELHHGRCFYCGGALRSGDFDVDHFVPWSRSPLDLAHNFVPAHRACNGRKSDHLAAEIHLARWCDRNHRHGVDLAAFCDGHALRHDARVSLAIAQSAYEAVDQQHGKVWLAGDRFEPLGDTWKSLLRAA